MFENMVVDLNVNEEINRNWLILMCNQVSKNCKNLLK